MNDQNVCPVCGYKLEVGTYETMRTKLYVAVCTVCGTSGPIRGSWIGAKEALAHPAHLMRVSLCRYVDNLANQIRLEVCDE
jgi:hypothetical protein